MQVLIDSRAIGVITSRFCNSTICVSRIFIPTTVIRELLRLGSCSCSAA